MIDTVTAVMTLMADEPRNTGPDFGKASPFGLLIVLVLLIGTFALVWSMNRHLRKLPESFDRAHPEPDQAADEGTAPAEEPDAQAEAANGNSRESRPGESGG
ncbi:hypothetical protein [Mycolicibacterium mageritense]|uniref:hypothetical protein n=1 Tax=Mycolicibacterium mageritense TaxID=53462 RepID=UPI001E5C7A5F|nr:hypothetical protein [Mycolicibacterium mageritense]GJJ17130.1 hypothetical protein MTY414_08030 [Mycolicibacterium mageritense]